MIDDRKVRILAVIGAIATIVLAPSLVASETIFVWTDRNGVRHFSDQPPPEGAVKTDQIETQLSEASRTLPDQRRQAIEQMTEEYRREALEAEQKRLQKEQEQNQARERRQQDQLREKIEAERQRLLDENANIRGRAVNRTLTQGMKNAQIEALEKKLAILESDPQVYFNQR
jgi:colicin import membrane protein